MPACHVVYFKARSFNNETSVFLSMVCRNYYAADTWAAVWIALMTCGTMFPMSVYSGKILLQVSSQSHEWYMMVM